MAIQKRYQREADTAGRTDRVQALTQASTGTTVNNYGVTTITSAGSGTAANHGFSMAAPVTGIRKTLVIDPNSTRTVTVNFGTGVSVFADGSTSLVFSTGSGYRTAELVGVNSTAWALVSNTTGVTPT